jgi:hypothetical protein
LRTKSISRSQSSIAHVDTSTINTCAVTYTNITAARINADAFTK